MRNRARYTGPRFDSSLPIPQPSLLKYRARAFTRSTGIDLKRYHRAIIPVIKIYAGKMYVFTKRREIAEDPGRLLNRYYNVPPGVSELDAQLFVLYDTYQRAKLDMIYDELTGERKLIFRSYESRELPQKKVLQFRCSLVKSPSCVPLLITSKDGSAVPRAQEVLNDIPRTPDYVMELYSTYVARTADPKPFTSFENSRLRGSGIEGISSAYGEMARLRQSPLVDKHLAMMALDLCYRVQGFEPGIRFPPPAYYSGCFEQIDFDPKTSGGVKMTHPYTFEEHGRKFNFSNNPKKGASRHSDYPLLDEMSRKLWEKFKARDFSFSDSIYRPHIYIPKVKVESAGPGDDPYKNRIFMIPEFWKFALDKFVQHANSKYSKRKGMNGQGLSWQSGDAQRLANQLYDFPYIADYDFSRYDQSLLFMLLCIIMGYQWMYTEAPDQAIDWNFDQFCTWHHMTKLINDLAAKKIQFPDEYWRLIIGMMMSGDYATAFINQNYHLMVVIYCDLLKGKQLASQYGANLVPGTSYSGFSIAKMVKMNYEFLIKTIHARTNEEAINYFKHVWLYPIGAGDDGMRAIRYPELVPYFGLKMLKVQADESFGMLIKYANCNECDTFISQLDEEGNIRTRVWIDPDGESHNKPHGPVFLKRYFILTRHEGELVCVPFRKTDDIWYRLGRTPTDVRNPLMMLIRIHGLMLDSLGTNPWMYNFLSEMADILLEMFPGLELQAEDIPEDFLERKFREMMDAYRHRGIDGWRSYDLRVRPDFDKMRDTVCVNSQRAFEHGSIYCRSTSENSLWEQPFKQKAPLTRLQSMTVDPVGIG